MTILFNLFGCAWGVNDADNHTCKSIQQSKDNGFFITEYSVEQTPNDMFDILEVWQEKTWYYKIVNWFKVTKEFRTHTSGILMTVKETKQSRYRMDNYFTEWSLLQDNTTNYVGYSGGPLCLGIENWSSPEEIRLTLIEDPRGEKRKAGTIILRRKK